MAACTFFGHHDCPEPIRPLLKNAIASLIEQHGVDTFYVGNHGTFDAMAAGILREFSQTRPHLDCCIVLAYLPTRADTTFALPTLYPQGLETVPKRFAISHRNDWMLQQADYVITYITHSWGGAAQFAQKAHRRGKTVIALGSYDGCA